MTFISQKTIHAQRTKRQAILREMSDDDIRTLAEAEAAYIETNRPLAAALVDELVRRMRKAHPGPSRYGACRYCESDGCEVVTGRGPSCCAECIDSSDSHPAI